MLPVIVGLMAGSLALQALSMFEQSRIQRKSQKMQEKEIERMEQERVQKESEIENERMKTMKKAVGRRRPKSILDIDTGESLLTMDMSKLSTERRNLLGE